MSQLFIVTAVLNSNTEPFFEINLKFSWDNNFS